MKQNKAIAIFDLDGTLTSKDTYLEFIKYAKGPLYFFTGILVLSPKIIGFYLKLISNNRLKLEFFNYFFGKSKVSEIRDTGMQFAVNKIPMLLRPGAQQVLRWHIDQGHEVLILTASSDLWVHKWCEVNGFNLIATKFQTKANQFTGEFDGFNCYGLEKKKLLLDYFKDRQFDFKYGYGDSKADSYFLELVDRPYLMVLNSENVKRKWTPEIMGQES
ncbi:MAG: hypothetical protein RLZZ241_1018 [Bacteroidota bacterium]